MTQDWSSRSAPSLAEIDALARDAFEALPDAFRQLAADVLIRVEDFPTEEVGRQMGLQSPFDILGLYQGVALPGKSMELPTGVPDMVFLYRRPLLDVWAEGEETLGHLITHVLVHEIGHHFGLSDADMERIEASVAS
jgi:predicted Zn-dependent protease with MMP-like domain